MTPEEEAVIEAAELIEKVARNDDKDSFHDAIVVCGEAVRALRKSRPKPRYYRDGIIVYHAVPGFRRVVADCKTDEDAERIAKLLNEAEAK
jgi:hypothetical protein